MTEDSLFGDSDSDGVFEESESGPVGRKLIQDVISDAGTYSYASLCANCLSTYFTNEYDKEFSRQFLQTLIQHLGLPKQVESVMYIILEGQHPTENETLVKLLMEEPALRNSGELIIQDLVLFSIRRGIYDSRARVLISYIGILLRINRDMVEYFEDSVVDLFVDDTHEESEEEKKESQRRSRNRKVKRYFMIGLATVGGGALLGLTGGLAAPFVAAGAGAIIGGAGAAALGSTAGVAVIGSLFGVAGAGLTGFKMKKRVGAVEEFAFDYLTEANQLHITVAISGWLLEDGPEFFKLPWKNLLNSREQYCLRYESNYLRELGKAMDYLFSFAVSMAAQEALKYTILSGIITAIAWPASLLTLASVIDNPWSVCIRRSAEVGKLLADVLISKQQGQRPVTLIGFSLGARVIYYCLQEMARRKGSSGIIEDVILLGAPVSGSAKDWQPFAKVVAGKIINGYCRSDWLLKFLYRTSSVSVNIAGLHPVEWEYHRMHNFDLSDLVTGHMDYSYQMDLILKTIGIRTCDDVENIDAFFRKMSDFSRCINNLGATTTLAVSKPMMASRSFGQLRPASRDGSVSTVDSGLARTATDISLSDSCSNVGQVVGRESQTDLSQLSLASQVTTSENAYTRSADDGRLPTGNLRDTTTEESKINQNDSITASAKMLRSTLNDLTAGHASDGWDHDDDCELMSLANKVSSDENL